MSAIPITPRGKTRRPPPATRSVEETALLVRILARKDGVEHYDLRVIVSDLRLKNRRGSNDEGAGSSVGPAEDGAGGGMNDEIPF